MKKGFTLIELLAVIVILAIIAVIATPIVLNIINDTKESAILRSADFYLEGVETSIATSVLKGITISDGTYPIMQDGNLCLGTLSNNTCTGDILKVEMDGEVPNSGTIKIENGQVVKNESSIKVGDYTVTFENGVAKAEEAGAVKKLAPGLYDENDNLKISWADLTSTDYKSITHINDDFVEATSAILTVDEDGVLKAAFDEEEGVNYSAEYLVGKLIIDDSVTSISHAFYDCTGLTSITIPDGVTNIGINAFYNCTGLTSITIPDGVTNIGWGAFSNCKGLKSIIIPDGVTEIEQSMFQGCQNLTNVIIPDSVTSISFNAFYECTSLNTINYKGTEAEWNAITKKSSWDYKTPSNKEIIYNYKG